MAGLGSGYREAGLREGSWVGGQTSSQFSYTVIYLITQRVLYFYFYFYNRCLHSSQWGSELEMKVVIAGLSCPHFPPLT